MGGDTGATADAAAVTVFTVATAAAAAASSSATAAMISGAAAANSLSVLWWAQAGATGEMRPRIGAYWGLGMRSGMGDKKKKK